jgi:colicin import membrane protein
MTATWLQFDLGPKEAGWGQMLILSFVFHLAIFFGSVVLSKSTSYYPSLEEHVYHVELVEPPAPSAGYKTKGTGIATGTGKDTAPIVKTGTRRIDAGKKQPTAVVAKRISPKPLSQSKKETASASKLIDGAISRVKKEVVEQGNQLEDTLSRIEKRVATRQKVQAQEETEKAQTGEAGFPKGSKGGLPIGPSGLGKGIQLYQVQIHSVIKTNWSYPVALINARGGESPEAVILLTLRSDGKIVKAEFKKRSRDPLFNDSVLKALEKSDPLPRFPPGYNKSSDEVEIRFSLKDLMR